MFSAASLCHTLIAETDGIGNLYLPYKWFINVL
jgi:hypothetical protein